MTIHKTRNLAPPCCWLSLAMLMLAMPVRATESSPWHVHGYGTLGALYHNVQGAEYRRDISQAMAGAQAGHLGFRQDSMLAVQADYRAGDAWSASVQVVSRQDADNDFTPQFSMAHLKYHSGACLLRAGRLIIETYQQGDAAEVGYANMLVRQPVIFYPRYMDGMDAELSSPLGDGLLRVKALSGRTVGKLVSGGGNYDTRGSRLSGVGVEYGTEALSVRGVLGRLDLRNEVDDMLPGGRLTAALPSLPNGAQLQDVFTMRRTLNIRLLEFSYDLDGWQGHAGYAITRTQAWPDQYTVFANTGYRLGAFTPYAAYSMQRMARDFTGSGIPDGYSAQSDALNQSLLQAQAWHFVNQTDLALGLRYDFMRNQALKVQWDHFHYQDPESIIDRNWTRASPQGRGFKSMNLYSVVFDFIF